VTDILGGRRARVSGPEDHHRRGARVRGRRENGRRWCALRTDRLWRDRHVTTSSTERRTGYYKVTLLTARIKGHIKKKNSHWCWLNRALSPSLAGRLGFAELPRRRS